jgi:Domain of unknown function (DUF3806)
MSRIVLTHASRHVWSRLTFDVSQEKQIMSITSTRELNPVEIDYIKGAREWINDILCRGFKSEIRLNGDRNDIPTLHSLLSRSPFSKDAKAELITFGIAFGDVMAHDIPMKWVVYEDHDGKDYALQYSDSKVFVFPLDMIVKRVEEGISIDQINLETMLEEIRNHVTQIHESNHRG